MDYGTDYRLISNNQPARTTTQASPVCFGIPKRLFVFTPARQQITRTINTSRVTQCNAGLIRARQT